MNSKRSKNTENLIKKTENSLITIAQLIPGLKDTANIAKKIIEIQEKRKEDRIELFCKKLIEGSLTAGEIYNKDNPGYEIEFGDLLQACMNDSDSSKSTLYAQLTIALRFGDLDKEKRRHFVLSLKQLSFEDLELLRESFIVSSHEIIPKAGNAILSQSDVFNPKNLSSIRALSISTLTQLGAVSRQGITELGKEFIRSIYQRESLTPDSMRLKVWQKPYIAILTDPTKNEEHDLIVNELKKLRVRCVKLNIAEFSPQKQNLNQYKAIILSGNYKDLLYSRSQDVIKHVEDNTYKYISLGHNLPSQKSIALRKFFSEAEGASEKSLKIAKEFEFITDTPQ